MQKIDKTAQRIRSKNVARSLTLSLILSAFCFVSTAQNVSEMYHMTDGATHSKMDFHQVTVVKGQEQVLAELSGSGKVT